MQEFELIQEFFQARAKLDDSIELGIGDDCALLTPPPGQSLAVSTDTVVEGVHFLKNTPAQFVASRALGAAISDLAAMGAKPSWFTLALTLPNTNPSWLRDFSQSLFDCAKTFSCLLVGGDTTKGPLSIGVQVMGFVDPALALKRSGAKVGDKIYVSGSLGDSAAGLAVLKNKFSCHEKNYLVDRFYKPQARIALGQNLLGIASAALDVSDGLVADLKHLCVASKVGAKISLDDLPLSSALKTACNQKNEQQIYQWALSGGDDYELCFTAAPEKEHEIKAAAIASGTVVSCVGEICAGREVSVVQKGELLSKELAGYEHFS